ncbi:MAG: Hsp70 family protein [Deltaproteobacteria bacterium]|nr:Hsp70 family protein [Deltaproteobacteria bacterium]
MAADNNRHFEAGHIVDGRYELQRLLGEGAMGAVYEARNVWTQRRVAVKVLLPELARIDGFAQRFILEGRSATMVSHPSVVEVLDMGRDPADGSLYLVQEFLVGTGLDVVLAKRGRLPVRDALDIAVPVMAALAAAHRRGIVHRDVKPANILLAQTASGIITPKLIDFGVAKLLSGDRPTQTQPGVLVGTPCYMSPEQLLAEDQIDQRADVWAMGVVLYEMLAGRRPFDGALVQEVCVAIARGQFAALGSLAKEAPDGLVRAIYQALARRKDERHESMEAFLDALLSAPGLEETCGWLVERHGEKLPYRRHHPRYAVHWSCDVSCASWGKVLELVSANVSRGGVFLLSGNPPQPGAKVEVGLVLPDGARMRLRGAVVRVIGPEAASSGASAGFAVHFDQEHATELSVLEQVAAAHQSPGYEALPEAVLAPRSPAAPEPKPAPQSPRALREQLADAVGIDFGTTYSSVSIAFKDRVYPICDARQRSLHPSIVSFPRHGGPVVGWDARQRHLSEPERTVRSIKRLLGRSIDEPTLQGYLGSLPYPTVRGPGNAVVLQIDDTPLAPVQVAAEIIGLLRKTAESRTGKEILRAVLSVPLDFTEAQRQAVQRAASMAGLEVLELIGEPIAALLAYGLGQNKREVVAVYDFGGGTFDFSVVDMQGDHHRVLANGGDAWLGGDDFDLAIATAAADRFWRETRVDLRQRAVEWQRLLYASEHAKRMLTAQEQTELVVEKALEHPAPRDLRWSLSRADLEALCKSAIEASIEVCRDALAGAGVALQRVDRVVITGGTSRVPVLQRELARFFGKPVTSLVDPEMSVCIGAGLRAAMLTKHQVRQAAHRAP